MRRALPKNRPQDPDPAEGEDGTPEADLWFLPGPDLEEDDVPPGAPPLPRADRRPLIDPGAWLRAEREASGDLARVALLFGELDARLRDAPTGLRQRLAQREAADLSWWAGDRVSPDRLALWTAMRIGATEEDAQAVARAGWAVRKLSGGPPPATDLSAFLERPGDEAEAGLRGGAELGAVAELVELLEASMGLHPVTQAAMLFRSWRILGAERSRDIEAAVLAARHGGGMARRPGQGALFLPIAATGSGALRAGGPPDRALRAWLAGAEQATLGTLMQLDRLVAWRRRAGAATSDLSGRTPRRLIEVVEAWPLVSAPLAEAETGASRAATQRNLERLEARGLIREMTGQGRYRVWTAAL